MKILKSIRLYVFVVLIITLAISEPLTAVAQEPTPPNPVDNVLGPEESLLRDAEWYAIRFNVTLEEAVSRIKIQHLVGELDVELTENEKDTFSGLWIQHVPDFRIIVSFTRNGNNTILPYVQDTPLADFIEVHNAKVNLSQLTDSQISIYNLLYNLGVPLVAEVDIIKNRIKLYVTNKTETEAVLQKTNRVLPDNVDMIQVQGLVDRQAYIYGGLKVDNVCSDGKTYVATSGYILLTSTGVKRFTTAGHACNSVKYKNVSLPFLNQALGTYYDFQWHSIPSDFSPKPWVQDNIYDSTPYYREITGRRNRTNQSVGEIVCKYGAITHYTCGTIQTKGFCYQGVCTWVRVDGGNTDLSSGGDSGAPWFSGSIAYGIHTGELSFEPNDAIYMAINYVEDYGFTVYTK
jgi:hypothetical protein